MTEVHFRERDVRHAEAMMHVQSAFAMHEHLIGFIAAVLKVNYPKEQTEALAREIDRLATIYRDKLFHIGYLPDYAKIRAEDDSLASRSSKAAFDLQAGSERVAAMRDDDPI